MPATENGAARRSLLLAGVASVLAGEAAAQGTSASTSASTPGPAGQSPLALSPAAQTFNAMLARANAGTVGVIAGGVDGTYIRIAADLAAVLDEPTGLRVLPIVGKGSLQNIADILLLRGIDIGIVQADALAVSRRQRQIPGVETLIQYISKLYDEEVHLLARPGTATLRDLAGQVVNVDVEGSGTAMTASLMFDSLGLPVQMAHDTQDVALDRLRRGEIAALVYVAGKPTRLFSALPADSLLHFLALPPTPSLMDAYLPGSLSHADYPALVPPGAQVETLAVGAVMAVYAWPPGSERHRKVARFVEALQARFADFLQPPRHAKWHEVNLAAQVPGWRRFEPALPPARPRRPEPAAG